MPNITVERGHFTDRGIINEHILYVFSGETMIATIDNDTSQITYTIDDNNIVVTNGVNIGVYTHAPCYVRVLDQSSVEVIMW